MSSVDTSIHPNLPTNLETSSTSRPPKDKQASNLSERIDFTNHIAPHIGLLTTLRKIETSCIKAVAVVEGMIDRVIAVIVNLCLRLFVGPEFDPDTPAFKNFIETSNNQIQHLEQRLVELEPRFKVTTLIFQDLEELKQLYFATEDTLERLAIALGQMEADSSKSSIYGIDLPKPPIYETVIHLKATYEKLDRDFNGYLNRTSPDIFKLLTKAIQPFTNRGIELPEEFKQQLSQAGKDARFFIQRYLSPKDKVLLDDLLFKLSGATILDFLASERKSLPSEPYELSWHGNSCYFDSVLQSLLNSEEICKQIRNPLPPNPMKPEKHKQDLAIQQLMIKLMDAKNQQQKPIKIRNYLEFILHLITGDKSDTSNDARNQLRDIIFNLGMDEYPLLGKYDQQDAAPLLEVFLDRLVTFRVNLQQHATTRIFPGREFVYPATPEVMWQVPILENTDSAESHPLFEHMMAAWGAHLEIDLVRTFNPASERCLIKDQNKASHTSANIGEKNPGQYRQWFRLTSLPDVLPVQLKRFHTVPDPYEKGKLVSVKNNDKVELPEKGILDLSKFYEPIDGLPQEAFYKTTSYLVHIGSTQRSGHYIAYLEKDGEYYECDDFYPQGYKKISREEFFAHTDAYIVFLKRISREEAESILKQTEEKKEKVQNPIAFQNRSSRQPPSRTGFSNVDLFSLEPEQDEFTNLGISHASSKEINSDKREEFLKFLDLEPEDEDFTKMTAKSTDGDIM